MFSIPKMKIVTFHTEILHEWFEHTVCTLRFTEKENPEEMNRSFVYAKINNQDTSRCLFLSQLICPMSDGIL